MPTKDEEKAINAGIAADPDAFELGEDFFKSAIRTTGTTASEIASEVQRRGKQKAPTKERITIRFSPEVLESFRATGRGWQTRMDNAMKEWIKTHKPG